MVRTLLVCSLVAASGAAWAVDGLPDSTFGILASGKNVVALNQGGSNSDTIVDVLVNPDRSILMVGTSRGFGSISRYSITKLTPNGTVDPSFGTNGTVYSAVANVQASRARLDASGNVVIVGTATFNGTDKDFHVCRYSAVGQPVAFSSLNSNCRNVAFDRPGGNLTDEARDFRIDSSGRIIIVGSAGVSATSDYAAVTRITAAGQIDDTFTDAGKVMRQFVPNAINHFNALAQRSDGKFYTVGEAGDAASMNGTAVLFSRLTVSGNPDPTFQGSGFVMFGFDDGAPFHRNEAANAVEILSDGRALVAGNMDTGSGATEQAAFIFKHGLNDFGSLVNSFGNSGRVTYSGGYSADFSRILVQSDDKIVVVGSRKATVSDDSFMHVIRLLPNGQLDGSEFGAIGRADVDFFLAEGNDYGVAAASQDGKLLIAGHSPDQNAQDMDQTITRLHNDLIFADGVE